MAETHRDGRIQGHRGRERLNPTSPIGVFDSGIGGLSVLDALIQALPEEDFVYVGDGGHAPYGERDDRHVIARSHAVLGHLVREHGIKLFVVACNTATAAAITHLRAEFPGLPIVGIEPALKPACALSQTHRIGVMATRGTLGSAKFAHLLQRLSGEATFVLQPCDGLADAIERQARTGADGDEMVGLLTRYVQALGAVGTQPGMIDTVVLGCTHYPLASQALQRLVGPEVRLVEPGAAVARQARHLLDQHAGRRAPRPDAPAAGRLRLLSTDDPQGLEAAARHWLRLSVPATYCPID
jgi:glutamate racemase